MGSFVLFPFSPYPRQHDASPPGQPTLVVSSPDRPQTGRHDTAAIDSVGCSHTLFLV